MALSRSPYPGKINRESPLDSSITNGFVDMPNIPDYPGLFRIHKEPFRLLNDRLNFPDRSDFKHFFYKGGVF